MPRETIGPNKTTSGTRGQGFLDIHLNPTTRWKDVPEPVWTYTLGGYQVLKKWLSCRESALLGRPLTSDEAQQFHPPRPPHRQHSGPPQGAEWALRSWSVS